MLAQSQRYSFKILIQMLLCIVALVLVFYGVQEWFLQTYVQFQVTQTGIIINGLILFLFLAGLLHIALLLKRYMHEEKAMSLFQKHAEQRDPLQFVGLDSLIVQRYLFMQSLHQQHAQINQAALAASLNATEKAKTYVPRFINNILILVGVFGTVVSLSMALTGSAGLLQSSVNEQGMGMVIHGMSTALSTTMSAISCYFFFNYFFNALQHAQSHLFGQLESMTSLYLMPKFQTDHAQVEGHMLELIRSLKESVSEQRQARQELQTQIQASQQSFQQWGQQVQTLAQNSQAIADTLKLYRHDEEIGLSELHQALKQIAVSQLRGHEQMSLELQHVQSLLQQGFRLEDEPS